MTSTVADQVRLYVVRGTAGEISEGIRNLISAGVLAPGDALPPIRALADDLEVHRNTVAGAYRLLVAAGVVETQGRRGSFVRAIPFLEGEGGIALPGSVDLASGNPDPALLPDLRASLDRTTYTPRLYGAAATEPLLDSWARSSIEDEVPRPCSITITNGAVDAVERLLTAHLTRGDAVAIEDPCFLASIGTLKANSFRAVPMDIDTSGITPQGLLRALESGVRAIICTPRAHNPTGVSMSADRAAILGSILAEFPHVLVIEDDHFSAVSSNRYCRLAPMSTTRWALVRSVSKFLGPDLRVAVVASDLDTGIRLSTHPRSGANWVSHLQQRLSAELLSDPTVIDGLANARAVYERRRTLLKSALSEHDIEVPDTFDGLNVWVPLDRDSEPIVERLAESGWLVRDGSQFSATPGQCHRALRVTASTITSDQAREFASALAEILASP